MTTAVLPGDFGLVHTRDLGGRAIGAAELVDELVQGHWGRAARDSLFRHAVLVERVDGDLVHAIEARPSGAGRATYRLDDPAIVWSAGRLPPELTPTAAQRPLIVQWGVEHIGDGYDWDAYARQAAVRLHLPLAAAALARQIEQRHQEMCSQYVDCAYQFAGVHLFADGRAPYDVAPSDLAYLIRA